MSRRPAPSRHDSRRQGPARWWLGLARLVRPAGGVGPREPIGTVGPVGPVATVVLPGPVCMALLALVALLTACASQPPPPDWQLAARSALEQAVAATLRGDTRVAEAEAARARAETARTVRPELLARAELLLCAAAVASLQPPDCPRFAALRADAAAPERAYAAHLAGWDAGATPPDAAQRALLPPAQQAVATLLAAPDAGDAATAAALQRIEDPLSRLLGAALALRHGRAGPAVLALAIDTASAQGWRRPLLAWLLLARQAAQQRGDAELAQRLQRRIELLAPAPAAPAAPAGPVAPTAPAAPAAPAR